MHKVFKILAYGIGAVLALAILLGLAGWAYVDSLELDAQPRANPASTSADLEFLRHKPAQSRGKILAVVTSVDRLGTTGKKTGYELTELSRPYWIFIANGYSVDIASPLGGEPRMIIDDEDMGNADFAFLNDAQAMQKARSTLKLSDTDGDDYAAVFFVGGKGTMWDFPGNADIHRILKNIEPRGVIGAVCHGPAALLDITLDNGKKLLQGKRVAAFTNAEELFLIPEAETVFPFLLQDQLSKNGAKFIESTMYLDNTVVDGNLVTGQNPWSTWSVAEAMITALGHQPVPRVTTDEEISVRLLTIYHQQGLDKAIAAKEASPPSSKILILMHAVVAGMQKDIGKAFDLQALARH